MTTATPSYIYARPWLYPAQKDAIFSPARYAVIEASTKSGKTVGCIAWLLEQAAAGRPGRNYWWVAPVYMQAEIAHRRLQQGLPREHIVVNKTEMTIGLPNGTKIWFKSADKPDNLYGEDVYAAVLDEATRMREEAWHAIRTTLTATRGPVRIIGNVKGRRNWAYRLARRAESGETGMHYARITAMDAIKAGVLELGEVEDAQRQLPDNVYRELYMAEAADDEGNPFGIQAIGECLRPLSEEEPAAWGWDLAKSVDWTVGVALDASGHTCRFQRFQLPWQETMLRIRSHSLGAQTLVDATGVGDPILEELQRGPGKYDGFIFTAKSKQQLMEALAVAIQQHEITFPPGPIQYELESFEYSYTASGVRYGAPEGLHDDCVCGLALAWWQLRHQRPKPRIRWVG